MTKQIETSEISSDTLILDKLISNPILKNALPRELAHMLMHVEYRKVDKGEILFREHEPTNKVFLIESGEFTFLRQGSETEIERRKIAPISGEYLGQEGVLGAKTYLMSVIALKPSTVIVIPTRDIIRIAEFSPEVKNKFFQSYTNSDPATHSNIANAIQKESEIGKASDKYLEQKDAFPIKETLGWLITFFGTLGVWITASHFGLEKNSAYYVAIIASAVFMWIFNIVPAFAPPLFVVIMAILLDIVDPNVAVSGFASGSFFMLLSVFGVGAVMVVSGLTFRISLLILKLVPSSSFWYSVSLFFSGFVLTPVVPSQGARTAIISPFLVDIMGASEPQQKDMLGAHFLNSTLGGVGLMASVFLTGKPANLIVLGMFDYQTQFAFQWLQWLLAASFTGILMFIMFFAISWLVFRNARDFKISSNIISKQLKVLGPTSSLEWGALGAIGVLVIGILFTSVHKVDIPWMSFSILTVLILFGFIGNNEIRSNIDWTTLIFVGAIIAWLPVMSKTGIDKLVASNLEWLGIYMKTSLPIFIGMLCAIIVLVRLVLPEPITVILFVTALFPLANSAGISPWVVGFIILTMAEAYIFSYQCGYFIQIKEILLINGLDSMYDEKRIIVFNILMIIGRILAIYASIPFWRYLNII
ncbi:MAG: anion permease [Desulfamplus sp.]|nr:anion permease [Desulfamplus sp.]